MSEIITKPRIKRIKKYADYQVESEMHYSRIISNYGMSKTARPPSPLERSEQAINFSGDRQFRSALSRTLYMKRGGSFNVDNPRRQVYGTTL